MQMPGGDGTIVTVASPDAINPSASVRHEIEPCCAAFRLGQPIVASVCLHRRPDGGRRTADGGRRTASFSC